MATNKRPSMQPVLGPSGRRPQGWEGWDAYAPFYDWENAQTLGRRDVPFWRRVAAAAPGRVLELGCGTGRLSLPLAKAGIPIIGIDRSAAMLDRAARGARRSGGAAPGASRPPRRGNANGAGAAAGVRFVRGDIRTLPFARHHFATVLAPYGVLQSLLAERDLAATLDSVGGVLAAGGTFGIDLVPDVPNWREYDNRVQLRGPAAGGVHLTLIESVQQDPRRRLTTFNQVYVERRGRKTTEHRFTLTFRTLSVRQMTARLERGGFEVEAVLGDYDERPWHAGADVCIIMARRSHTAAVARPPVTPIKRVAARARR